MLLRSTTLDNISNCWGLLESDNDIVDLTDGTVPRVKGNWDTVLRRVSIFLQQSGLSYKKLLELLGTYFINSINSETITSIESIDPDDPTADPDDPTTCRLSHLQLQGANIAALNRIHRFVRLWRKLGWTMRDLGKAITAQPKKQ